MKVKRKGTEIEFDFRLENERIRGVIPIDTLAEIIRGNSTKSVSNLGKLNKIILFKDFAADIYLPRFSKPNKKESTYRTEVDSIRVLNEFFGNYPLHNISRELREQFKELRLTGKLSKFKKACSHNRINNNLSCLNQIFEYAKSLGYIKENVLEGLKRLPSENRKDKWLRKPQIESLLDACRGNFRNFIGFLTLTGARVNEALKFNIHDFNQSKTDFRLLTLKSRKSQGERFRWLKVDMFGDRFIALLENMRAHPKTGYFFFNKEGNPLADSSVRHVFCRVRKKVGLTDVILHDMRHTFAMHRAISGVNLWQLRAEMGHTSADSIQRYLDDAKMYDRMESIFYQEIPKLSVHENRRKRTEKRTEIPNETKIYKAHNQ